MTSPNDRPSNSTAPTYEPSPSGHAEEKTQIDLEWARVVAAVRARCQGPLHESLTRLELHRELAEVRRAMGETAELLRLRKEGDAPPLGGIQPVRSAVLRVEKGGDRKSVV